MPSNVVEIPINEVVSQFTMTVKIKGMKRWQISLWIARQIFIVTSWIVARLIGTKLEVQEE